MIDGMGVTGVEGVFRRCCEKTLSVMRANKEALVTIIEVCLLSKGFLCIWKNQYFNFPW
jgi:phosphatidylinositol kinase/protein kinase (PI-3  family)